jgi:hypothetical protein
MIIFSRNEYERIRIITGFESNRIRFANRLKVRMQQQPIISTTVQVQPRTDFIFHRFAGFFLGGGDRAHALAKTKGIVTMNE